MNLEDSDTIEFSENEDEKERYSLKRKILYGETPINTG